MLFKLFLIKFKLRVYFYYSDTITEVEVKRYVDDYLGVLTECLTDKIFIHDYHSAYPVDQDLDTMSQVCPEMYPLYRLMKSVTNLEWRFKGRLLIYI
jgi:hypothetical protein